MQSLDLALQEPTIAVEEDAESGGPQIDEPNVDEAALGVPNVEVSPPSPERHVFDRLTPRRADEEPPTTFVPEAHEEAPSTPRSPAVGLSEDLEATTEPDTPTPHSYEAAGVSSGWSEIDTVPQRSAPAQPCDRSDCPASTPPAYNADMTNVFGGPDEQFASMHSPPRHAAYDKPQRRRGQPSIDSSSSLDSASGNPYGYGGSHASHSPDSYTPYAPSEPRFRQTSYGDTYASSSSYPQQEPAAAPPPPPRRADTDPHAFVTPQMPPSTFAPMPSPSLVPPPSTSAPSAYDYSPQSVIATSDYSPEVQMQANGISAPDALGRDQRPPFPSVSFGFGGRLVLAVPPKTGDGGGYSFVRPPPVRIEKLATVLPDQPALDSFPGPLFLDGGTAAAAKAGQAKKRKEAIGWLEARIGEAVHEASFAPERKRAADDRAVLLRLIRLLIEHDGKLSGDQALDDAARDALLPEAAVSAGALPTAADLHAASATASFSNSPVIASYDVRGVDLERIEAFLLRGDRRSAIRYALDRSLWSHAFIIASSLDKEAWQEAVGEFARHELAAENGATDGLRIAYSVFAGLGAGAITGQPVAPPPVVPPPGSAALGIISRSATPVTPMPDPLLASKLPDERLARWRQTAGMIVANRTPGSSAALVSLGDSLALAGHVDAAHAWCGVFAQRGLTEQLLAVGSTGHRRRRDIAAGSDSSPRRRHDD